MKIGYPGAMFVIPPPSSGMGFANNSDTETLQLDTGGRHVVETPTTYKSFNMSWRSYTDKLQPLIDMYNKRYGTRPFYIQDLHGGENNILPPRWAYPSQLAAIHGAAGEAIYYGGYASFKNNKFSGSAPTLTVPLFEGKPMYLAVFKPNVPFTRPPMQYRLRGANGSTAWSTAPYTALGDAPTVVCTREQSQHYDTVELRVNLGGDIAIMHMDLSTSDYRAWDNSYRSAVGVGACKFTNTLDGDLTMLKAKRIGLSVDITEVQNV